MNADRRPPLAAFGLLVAICGAGCAIVDDAHEDHWRTLVVKDIVRRADLPVDVDPQCVNARAATDTDRIAVVQYRIGRAPYRHAFVLRAEDQVNVGDRVAVNPRLCTVRAAAAP